MNGETDRLKRELQKIKREIETHGNKYVFFRKRLDEDGEITDEIDFVAEVKGLFHVSGSYVSRETSMGTETRTKRSPMMLCAWEDVEEIKNKDFVVINDQQFSVVNKRNVNEYNIVCDMSMEVVINGDN